MKTILKLAILMALTTVWASCGVVKWQKVARGHDIKAADANSIVKGTTTERDILKMFGPPTKVRDTAEGKEFFYEYTKTGGPQWNLVMTLGGGTTTKTLLVWLNQNGTVIDYAFKQS